MRPTPGGCRRAHRSLKCRKNLWVADVICSVGGQQRAGLSGRSRQLLADGAKVISCSRQLYCSLKMEAGQEMSSSKTLKPLLILFHFSSYHQLFTVLAYFTFFQASAVEFTVKCP